MPDTKPSSQMNSEERKARLRELRQEVQRLQDEIWTLELLDELRLSRIVEDLQARPAEAG